MRPKLLEIEGLQSFRDSQRIDFETLGETGLFGIFGPTGSGKSTVLDAITLALYGQVKRADRGTQGIINTNMNTARVSFTFELIKDRNRRTFRVERVYQRKKGTVNSCEPKIARLIEITPAGEIPHCDKATEVTNTIKELLGLSHEDFTRAVVLPQNSFQEFLLLSNSDRRKMLERIFYLEEYGKLLQDKLSRKMTRLKSRIDTLSGELKGYADATPEALEEAQRAMETALTEKNKAEQALKQIEKEYNEAKAVWDLVQELAFIHEKEQQHLSREEDIAIKRVQLDRAQKADSLIEMIRNTQALSAKLKETEDGLNEVLSALPQVTQNLEDTRKNHDALKQETATQQPLLAGLRARLVDALAIRDEVQNLDKRMGQIQSALNKLNLDIAGKKEAISGEAKATEELELKLAGLKQEMEPLKTQPEYRQSIQEGARLENEAESLHSQMKEQESKVLGLKNVIGGLETKLLAVQKELAQAQQALDGLNQNIANHEAAKPEDRAKVQETLNQLHALDTEYSVLSHKKNELDTITINLTKRQAEYKALIEEEARLSQVRDDAQTVYSQCQKAFEKVNKALTRNAAWMLSKTLKEGEPCPVCGSEHHPKPAAHGEETEAALLEQQANEAKEKLNQAEGALKEAERAVLAAQEKAKALAEQIRQAQDEVKNKTEQFTAELRKLPEAIRKLPMEQMGLELSRMKDSASQKLKAIEAWEQKLEAYEKEQQKLRDSLNQHRLNESGILSELKVNKESLAEAQKALAMAQNAFNEKHQQYEAFLKAHNLESASAELKRLSDNDRRMDALQKQMEQIQTNLDNKRRLMDQWKEELRLLQDNHTKAQTEHKGLEAQKTEKQSKLKELAGDKPIEDEIKHVDEKLKQYSDLEKQYGEALKKLEAQYNDLTSRQSRLLAEKAIHAENLKTEEARLKAALTEKGFENSLEVEASLLPPEVQRALKDEIQDYDQTGLNIKAQKEMVQKKLNTRSITEEEWGQVSQAYQEAAAAREDIKSKSDIAKNHFEYVKDKHEKWIELNSTYQELIHKQELFDQIQKLLRANSFIDFIAEERLRYVAAKASETLGVMTRYKYALELDTDAGFIIRDNANGGVHRMVSSLSGGETFLTSLALALALSEQIQLKGQSPLEFFFLDEGFGTLDSSLLDTVMDALERLSRKERVIGLISHVPELKVRLGRRLMVQPPTAQGEGSRVSIEKN